MAPPSPTKMMGSKLLGQILTTVSRNPSIVTESKMLELAPAGFRASYEPPVASFYRVLVPHKLRAGEALVVFIDQAGSPQFGYMELSTGKCIHFTVDELSEEFFGQKRNGAYKTEAIATLTLVSTSLF